MSPFSTMACAASLALVSVASAEDMPGPWAVGVGIGLVPGVQRIEGDAGDATLSAKDSLKLDVCGSYTWALDQHWGIIAGPAVSISQRKGDTAGADFEVRGVGVDIFAGPVYRIDRNWKVELTPFIGYGRSRVEVDTGVSDDTQNVDCYDFGAKVGGTYTCDNHVSVSLAVGYEWWFTTNLDSGGPGAAIGGSNTTVSGHGLLATIGIGYGF